MKARSPAAERAFRRGVESHRGGDLAGAARRYEEALRADPRHGGALHHLGLLRHGAGRPDEAIGLLSRAAEALPGDASVRNNLANMLAEAGRYDEAIPRYREALALAPDHAGAAYNLGKALQRVAAVEEAVAIFERLSRSLPGDGQVASALAAALLDAGRDEAALEAAGRAVGLAPQLAETHNILGLVHLDRGDFGDAAACFRRALDIDPAMAVAGVNLTRTRRFDRDEDGDVARLRALAARVGPRDPAAADVLFALGKVHDDRGEHDAAFEQYERANALAGAAVAYDGDGSRRHHEALASVFSAGFFRDRTGFGTADPLPVLVVGMPRSGTTLVEQIIASHPLAHGAGELPYLERASAGLARRLGVPDPYPGCASHLDAATSRAIGEEYVARLRERAGDALRCTDKTPGNYRDLGLAALLLPRARVVHCRRHPLDTAVSIYFRRFTAGHGYAYRLEDIACEYRLYRALMRHWLEVLPLPVHEIDYEDLVAEPEAHVRALLEFCGLPWDPACLDFHRTRRAVHTASSWQVRQPLYDRSVGRWRHYERQLAPIADLADA